MKEQIKNLKTMIDACYTYEGAERDSYNYHTYIKQFEDILGSVLFEKVYTEYLQHLKDNFKIVESIYKDSDGLTYNSLQAI
jgi:hypothetical protein